MAVSGREAKAMLTASRIRKDNRADLCRRCINDRYDLNLMPSNCRYYSGVDVCPRCGGMHHIVSGLRLSGSLKSLFK